MNEFYEDESISSWLERQIFYQKYEGTKRVSPSLSEYLLGRMTTDIDYYSKNDLAELTSYLSAVPVDIFVHSSPVSTHYLLPSMHRTNFCRACVVEDLGTARTAVWRQSWSYGWYVVCDKHICEMTSPRRYYPIRYVGLRSEIACRVSLEAPIDTLNIARFIDNDLAIDCDQRRFDRIKILITEIAINAQNNIRHLILLRTEAASAELKVIQDLTSIILRRHRRGIESEPYCFQLAKKLTGQSHALGSSSRILNKQALTGQYEVSDNFTRMLALAIVAVLMRYPEANRNWTKAATLFGESGFLAPQNRSKLYDASVGEPPSYTRQWFKRRLNAYPVEFRILCTEFCQ